MIYNRYLDIHLCTETNLAGLRSRYDQKRFFACHGNEYFYEFTGDMMRQMRYRESKEEGFTFSDKNTGNCRVLNEVELTQCDESFLKLTSSVLDTTDGKIRQTYLQNEQLKNIRYVSCLVAIEHLQTDRVYPQLQALMLWISDTETVNKMRINSHGAGTSTSGMSMGQASLSPEQLITALTRHGLTRPSVHTGLLLGLAAGARWRPDSESPKCQKCKKDFVQGMFTTGRHHCRRCGGLFCGTCSSKKADLAVALSGKERGGVVDQYATEKNVKKARVCDACYQAVAGVGQALAGSSALRGVFGESIATSQVPTGQTNYGLKTITLALCMGARADDTFSVERDPNAAPGSQAAATGFVQNSLAARLLNALRDAQLKGIRVVASNQVLGVNKVTNRLMADCGVHVPTDGDSEKFAGANTAAFRFPAYIWGKRRALELEFKKLSPPRPSPQVAAASARRSVSLPSTLLISSPPSISGDIRVSPDGRNLFFSMCDEVQLDRVKSTFLSQWQFQSWNKAKHMCCALPGGSSSGHTWRLTAPCRVTEIKFIRGAPDKNEISIKARAVEEFKQYKSYDES